jgi:Ca2+-binding EF-hand superfamily protein
MQKFSKLAIPAAISVVLYTSIAWAASSDDVDTQTAMTDYISATFKKIDSNHDGKIDEHEWNTFMSDYLAKQKEKLDESFKTWDKNHDGKLTRAEAQAASPEMAKNFDVIDVNHDGYLTLSEIWLAILKGMRAAVDHPDGK